MRRYIKPKYVALTGALLMTSALVGCSPSPVPTEKTVIRPTTSASTSATPPESVRFCAMEKNGEVVRVPEKDCIQTETRTVQSSSGGGMSPVFWYFMGSMMSGNGGGTHNYYSSAPAYGAPLVGGSRNMPNVGNTTIYNAPAPGQSMQSATVVSRAYGYTAPAAATASKTGSTPATTTPSARGGFGSTGSSHAAGG